MTFTDPLYTDSLQFSGHELRQLLEAVADEGVVDPSGGALAVTERAAGANMSVDVAAGKGVIQGDTSSDQGAYLVSNDGTVNVTWPTADVSDPRIDLLVVQIRDNSVDAGGNNDATLTVVEGTAAGSPSAPAVPDTALLLAEVAVAAGVTSIVTANITDRRTAARMNRDMNPFPVGALQPYAGSTAPSAEWLVCDGRAVSRTTYADLWTLVGTTYGSGDGSTTFNVPDMRGRMPLGLDNLGGTSANRVVAAAADSLGGTGGAETHTLTTAQLPSHSHTVDPPNTVATSDTHSHGAGSYSANNYADVVSDNALGGSAERLRLSGADLNVAVSGTSATDTHNHQVNIGAFSSSSAGSDNSHNNMPPYMAVGWLIRAL